MNLARSPPSYLCQSLIKSFQAPTFRTFVTGRKSQWRTATELAKGTVDPSKSRDVMRGKKAVAQGQNNACMYIENENGQPVDGYRLSSIRQLAHAVWVKFAEMGMAPVFWGKASLTLTNEYKSEMCRRFPEFCVCENDWKLQQLATTDYPSWHSNYFGDTMDSKKKRPSFWVHDKSTEDPSTKKQKVEPKAENELPANDSTSSGPDSRVKGSAIPNDESTPPGIAVAVEVDQTGAVLIADQSNALPAGRGSSQGPSVPSFINFMVRSPFINL